MSARLYVTPVMWQHTLIARCSRWHTCTRHCARLHRILSMCACVRACVCHLVLLLTDMSENQLITFKRQLTASAQYTPWIIEEVCVCADRVRVWVCVALTALLTRDYCYPLRHWSIDESASIQIYWAAGVSDRTPPKLRGIIFVLPQSAIKDFFKWLYKTSIFSFYSISFTAWCMFKKKNFLGINVHRHHDKGEKNHAKYTLFTCR